MSVHPSDSQILDGYHLIRFLGRGGFGEVWLCRSGTTDTYHALKFISGNDPDLIEKEHHSLGLYRNAAARLRSPHLVPIEHINRHAAGLYYVMPLADGIAPGDPADPNWQPLSLAALIAARAVAPTWFSSQEIIWLIHPLLDALQSLSDAGLVHRDVKPENILFFNGSPCLGDISLLGEDAAVITRRGTPGYATPSWYQGGLPDMYGAAATLYTLLTGNLPDKLGRAAFLWPPQGEKSFTETERAEWKRLHGVIRRATEEKVSERFVDFAAMAGALAKSTLGKVTPPPRKKSRKAWIVAVLVLLAAWMMWGSPGRPDKAADDGDSQNPPAPSPSDPTVTVKPRKIYAMNAGGQFESNRQKILNNLGSILVTEAQAKAAREKPNYDISAYQRSSNIKKAFERKDYPATLEALDVRLAAEGVSSPEPEVILFRALLFKKLGREEEMQREISKVSGKGVKSTALKTTPPAKLNARMLLWEALGCYEEGEILASEVIKSVTAHPAEWKVGTAEDFYQKRARMRVLAGDFAGALADENSALALPLQYSQASLSQKTLGETDAQARQSKLNTVVFQWELLEQEFPQYADYLAARGSPEPLPDLRNLKDDD